MFGYQKALCMNSGAEAVETAIKLARKWAHLKKGIDDEKALIFSCTGNFHGRTMAAISLSSDPQSRGGFGPFVPGIGAICPVTKKEIRYGNSGDLETAFAAHKSHLAAIIVEPIQGEAGVIVPPPGYLQKCYDLCKTHNVLLIVDEIQTGLGRTGTLLASEYENVRPDILLLGKALSGGMCPASAVLADNDVMLCIEPGQHGSTYGGNPIACAVSMEALQVIEDEDLAYELGEYFRAQIRSLNCGCIKEVRGKGLLNAIELDTEHLQPSQSAWNLCLLLKQNGLLAKPTHEKIIRFAPPLCIKKEELDCALEIIKKSLSQFEEGA